VTVQNIAFINHMLTVGILKNVANPKILPEGFDLSLTNLRKEYHFDNQRLILAAFLCYPV